MLEIDLEILLFWLPPLGQTLLTIPALAGTREHWRPHRAFLAVMGQFILLAGFLLASTLPCEGEDCIEFRQSRLFHLIEYLHLGLSYTLLFGSVLALRR